MTRLPPAIFLGPSGARSQIVPPAPEMNRIPPSISASSSPTVMQPRPSSTPHPHARSLASITGLSLLILTATTQAADETTLLGFTAARAAEQQALEKQFDAQ